MKYRAYIFLCLLISLSTLLLARGLSHADLSSAVWTRREESPRVIVIDPGHGGEDGGACTAAGLCESRLNLEISLRVRDLLSFLGARTKMIRDRDISVSTEGNSIAARKISDIHNRVRITEETPNALLLSIHQNHFSQAKYRGAQVFYGKAEGSEPWAERLQEGLRTQVDPSNRRQCKLAKDIYLMEHVSCPAVLVECGFLSNFEEARQLQESSYQKKLAAVIACCTLSYTEEKNEI